MRPGNTSGTVGRKIALISNVYPVKKMQVEEAIYSVFQIIDENKKTDRNALISELSEFFGNCKWLLTDDWLVFCSHPPSLPTFLDFIASIPASEIDALKLAFYNLQSSSTLWVARNGKRRCVTISSDDTECLLKGTKSHLQLHPCISSNIAVTAHLTSSSISLIPGTVNTLNGCLTESISSFVTEEITLGSERHCDAVNLAIKGKVVVFTKHIPGKSLKYKVSHVELETAEEYSFDYYGEQMTLAEYFNCLRGEFKTWQVELREPRFPFLLVDDKGRRLPPELCFFKNEKINPRTSGLSVGFSQLSTKTSLSLSFACRRALDTISRSSTLIDSKPLNVKGRVLPDVTLEFRGKTQMTAVSGSWMLTGQKLLEAPQMVIGCAVLSFTAEDALEKEIVKILSDELRKYGLNMASDATVTHRFSADLFKTASVYEAISDSAKLVGGGLIIVFAPRRSVHLYSQVKTIAEVDVGVATQFLCLDNLHLKSLKEEGKRNAVFWQSLALEVNSKISTFSGRAGSPCIQAKLLGSKLFSAKPLVISSYVSAGDLEICAMTCTLDKGVSVFATQAQSQKPGNGSIREIYAMTMRLLDRYIQLNRELPPNVLYLRSAPLKCQTFDVVSEELAQVAQALLDCAIKSTGNSKCDRPRLTMVTVRKDHPVRLWCEKPADQDKKTLNIPTGTVIDDQVTESGCLSFILFSHASATGTARSTLYTVNHDEVFSDAERADELQQALYGLCHSSLRATRALRIPGPLEAARLLAERVRLYQTVRGDLNDLLLKPTLQSKLQGLSYFS